MTTTEVLRPQRTIWLQDVLGEPVWVQLRGGDDEADDDMRGEAAGRAVASLRRIDRMMAGADHGCGEFVRACAADRAGHVLDAGWDWEYRIGAGNGLITRAEPGTTRQIALTEPAGSVVGVLSLTRASMWTLIRDGAALRDDDLTAVTVLAPSLPRALRAANRAMAAGPEAGALIEGLPDTHALLVHADGSHELTFGLRAVVS